MINLSTLRYNLIELSSVGLDRNRLVPSFSGKSLYSSKSFLGRFFKLFQSKEKREEKLALLIERTYLKFWECIAELTEDKNTYLEAQQHKLRGEIYDLRSMEEAEKKLLKAALYLKPVFKAVEKIHSMPVVNFVMHQRDVEEQRNLFQLSGFIRFVQQKKNFELVTGLETPLAILRKLYMHEKIKAKEEVRIRQWIDKIAEINQAPPSGLNAKKAVRIRSGRSMHRYLLAISSYLLKNEPEFHVVRVGCMENKLVKRGLSILDEEDLIHPEWPEALQEGGEIYVGNQKIKLAEPLSQAAYEEFDQTRVFAIEGDPASEVVVYKNESMAFRSFYEIAKYHYGITLPKITAFSDQYQVPIRERLYNPLSELEWSQNQPFTRDDRRQIKTISDLLRTLNGLTYTPYPNEKELRASDFMFNAQGEMRSAIPMGYIPRNYWVLENFAYDCSRGIGAVYSALMKESGLDQTVEFKSYQRVVEKALKGEVLEAVASDRGTYKSQEIIETRTVLYEAIISERNKVLEDLNCKFETNKKNRRLVNKAIIETYLLHSFGFHIFEDFHLQVKERLTLEAKLELKREPKKSRRSKKSKE